MGLPEYLAAVEKFQKPLLSCEEFLGEGQFYVAPLEGCNKYPTIYTINVEAALTTSSTSASLQIEAPTPVTRYVLRQGQVLSAQVSAGVYVELTVAADAILNSTSPVTVPIEAPAAAVAQDSKILAFQVFEFIGLKSSPLDFQIGTEDVKILRDGLQGKTTKTNIAPQSSVEFLLRADDQGFWGDTNSGTVFDSALSNYRFYALNLRLNENHFITGPAETTALSFQNQSSQIQKATGTIVFQPTWYTGKLYAYQSSAQKAAYDDIRRLWLLAPIA